MRNHHKLTTAKKLTYPHEFIVVDTETTMAESWETIHAPRLIFGHAQFIRTSESLGVTEIHECSFRNLFDFWTFFSNVTSKFKHVTIYAHNWSFDFPVLDFYHRMEGFGYRVSTVVDNSPPIIITYTLNQDIVSVVDSMNYFPSSLKKMGESVGVQKGDIELTGKFSPGLAKYCRRDVIVLRESMLELMRFLHHNDICKLTNTLASLALCSYTRKFKPVEIYIDKDGPATQLGRRSYFGGRTEAFRLGKIQEKMYLIDINSQYPFIMSTNKFPTRIMGHYKNVSLNDLNDLTGRYLVTAKVVISTNKNVYPFKINNRTCFPVGEFVTTLSTPEIEYALENDHIKDVSEIVVYDSDHIFIEYVNFFYTKRQEYRSQGKDMWALFAKYLMNSLYGKFGQSHKEWEESKIEPKGYPHTESIYDVDTGKIIRIMEMNGQVFTAINKEEARDSFPGIAAHVTAGARIFLQRTMDFIGKENVYYCDTDSLLLNQKGYDRMKDRLSPTVLGMWALEGEYEDVEIYGVKDYRFGTKIKHKGVKPSAKMVAPQSYQQIQFSKLRGILSKGVSCSPILQDKIKVLHRNYEKGVVGKDGVVRPFELELGSDEPI